MRRTRRETLRLGGTVALLPLSGCTGLSSRLSNPFGSEDETSDVDGQEVVVKNDTPESQTVTVTVTNENGEAIFDHTYTLDPQRTDQSRSLEGDPTGGVIRVSSPRFETIREPYVPRTDSRNPYSDLPPDACPAMDIVVEVTRGGLAVTYACP